MNDSPIESDMLDFDKPPQWAREAIWYQILVERFRNGNSNVQPTRETCANALIDPIPEDWTLTRWGHNWYAQESWAKKTGLDFYRTIQMRRYGGDLAGVEEKIPYLKDLGINAIYFNPLNDAPSLHKYDARYYHHIDITFGDDIEGDLKLIASEDFNNPDTWKWTSADKKFIQLVDKLHKEGIRVILDFSWNHTGNNFWAFTDIKKNLENSHFKDWYECDIVKDAKSGKSSLHYDGWVGNKNLPEWKKLCTSERESGHPYEGNLHTEVKNHIFAVCKRWIDPKGNGDVSYGIDGMRLDVAEHVPMGFWRDFRKYVRSIRHDFYLIGENWWTQWPDILMDPAPWVQGDVFDAVMNYRWYKLARGYFAQPIDKQDIYQFKQKIDTILATFPDYTLQSMMNLAASHDSPRLLQSFANLNKYKYSCKPQEDPYYKTNIPNETTYHRVKLFILFQFTSVGAPHIWNGDEMGMTGADDPDCRKPLVWPDIIFESESPCVFSKFEYNEVPKFDKDMYEFYKAAIKLRKTSTAFSLGKFDFDTFGDDKNVLSYYRILDETCFLVLINNNPSETMLKLPIEHKAYKLVFSYRYESEEVGKLIKMLSFSAVVLKIIN